MWYVIQTRTGFEQELVKDLAGLLPYDSCNSCFAPVFEDVIKVNGECRIRYRRLFPGYVLIDTDHPEAVVPALKKVTEFTRLLGVWESGENDGKMFAIPVEDNERAFLESILKDGVMSVSYVERSGDGRIGRIIGPLAKYGNRIVRFEFRKRYAVVEAEIFGKRRRIKFGIWSDQDPRLPWIDEKRMNEKAEDYLLESMDIGIHPGDKVRDISGIYGMDEVFIVESVNPVRRKLRAKVMMLGEMRSIELYADQVERING